MSTETAAPVQMLNVQIDGVWMQFPKGTRVIEACNQANKYVPRYCYHPKLSSPGNCRMCLIEMGMPKMGPDRKPVIGADGKSEINWIPRPQISCAQDVAEGMGIRTDSQMVKECRQGVMEFLLINHPLDCPICDQAGECRLQEFSVEYGNGASRFLEHKVKKPKNVEVGPRVTLDAERCVLCSRCIRFMKEVAHDDVLGFVDRGSFSTIACHPDRTLESNYSLNTVDICPVGALTSSDFRFKMRVWFLKETKSICTSCATGCNTVVGSRENIVYRQTPRENNDVNSVWMCDFGRLNFHPIHSPERLTNPAVKGPGGNEVTPWEIALSRAATELKKYRGDEVAIIASGSFTNEELFLARKLSEAMGTTLIDIIPHNDQGDKILLSADRNANTAGAKLMGVTGGVPGSLLGLISSGLKNRTVKALIVLGEDATKVLGTEIANAQIIVATNILPNGTTKLAHLVFPGASFAEKRGSMINKKGRIQRLNRAIEPPGSARDDWEILRDLIQAVSGANGIYMIEDVFKQMAAATPVLAGLSLSKIGDLGVQLPLETGEAAAPPPKTDSPTAHTP
ncbi:MAG TPA: molybdopterin-dependent oxidoreductase [Chthoniobacteraceae bacterium]|jgi:NADH-quinone oxidoreductase subunit G|nr:molybdopterin-dependent oxidoreductase [Chthoniobacteraceae bacterium]